MLVDRKTQFHEDGHCLKKCISKISVNPVRQIDGWNDQRASTQTHVYMQTGFVTTDIVHEQGKDELFSKWDLDTSFFIEKNEI